jgi:uncharacterized metal-binding protein YceD (DUF177 family)
MAAGGAMTSLWPVIVPLAEVGRGPVKRELKADEATRKRLAKALDVDSLERLEATVSLKAWLDGAEIVGRWSASLTQTCVVTLDPLPAELEGDFTLRVVPEGSDAAPREGTEITLDPQEPDPPDVLESDDIDIGHYVVEHLALEIDPFPRTPGAAFEPPDLGEPESPFAVLRRLKDPPAEG